MVSASAATVDRDGLHRTNLRLLARALAGLRPPPEACLVDGFRLGPEAPPHRAIVDGDARSAAIAAASVIAKTARDRLMCGPAASAYPGFGFDRHVGYATPEHHAALRATGLSPLHRRSFQSVAYPALRLFGDETSIGPDERPGELTHPPAGGAAGDGQEIESHLVPVELGPGGQERGRGAGDAQALGGRDRLGERRLIAAGLDLADRDHAPPGRHQVELPAGPAPVAARGCASPGARGAAPPRARPPSRPSPAPSAPCHEGGSGAGARVSAEA